MSDSGSLLGIAFHNVQRADETCSTFGGVRRRPVDGVRCLMDDDGMSKDLEETVRGGGGGWRKEEEEDREETLRESLELCTVK
ncbi:hypothetical protein CBR_g3475 [Chara braunii]|uniref:Uncharacterized protein n=1 Tax=Chara braunii TaxID=69332 RepID=A0A388JR98_CHABU|nr:hypothetical protein CBR_g3475 [Chara braunii]|eukprot:GBG60232.1 hypothetical protein CBR_g3475 [Chara braunii]